MTIQETFSEWFRQFDQNEQNILLEYLKNRYFPKLSPPSTVESANKKTANILTDPEKWQAVCPTCKRGL